MAKCKSLKDAKILEMMEQMDDIISSGYGWSKWHERELTELFEPLDQPARQEVFEKYYGEHLPEGATPEEMRFMGKLCGVTSFTVNLNLED